MLLQGFSRLFESKRTFGCRNNNFKQEGFTAENGGYEVECIENIESQIDSESCILLAVSHIYHNEIIEKISKLSVSIYYPTCVLDDINQNPFCNEHDFVVYSSRKNGYFRDYRTLEEIAKSEKTDKYEHNFCNKYEFFLKEFKEEAFNMIELGVFRGASLSMWARFFPNANVIGVDINKDCKKYERDNIKVLIRDLSKDDSLSELKSYNPKIIVDDASHVWSHQINAFIELFPILAIGGVYIIEDIHTSFKPLSYNYCDQEISAFEFVSELAKCVTCGAVSDPMLDIVVSERVFKYKKEIIRLSKKIEMVSFIEDSAIIIKR